MIQIAPANYVYVQDATLHSVTKNHCSCTDRHDHTCSTVGAWVQRNAIWSNC